MPDSDALLEQLIRGLFDVAERLSLVAHGDGVTIGPWEALTNPAKAELWALPYAAQWVGAEMPKRLIGETDDAYTARARLELLHPRGLRRGTPRSLQLVAQAYLIGDQTVVIDQYYGSDPWTVGVLVFEDSVADLVTLTDAVNDNRVAIAGMLSTVAFIDSATWDIAQFESTFYGRTIADFEAAFDTVDDFESHEVSS